MNQTFRFTINRTFARNKNIPAEFIGVIERETEKAIKVFGRGTTKDVVNCLVCGRSLTHPVSRLVGIGPECGKHYWNETVLGPFGFTEAHAETLKRMVHNIKIDCWIPKSCVKEQTESDETVDSPPERKPTDTTTTTTTQVETKTVTKQNETLIIKFPYDPATIGQIKTLYGRRWDSQNKQWTAPVTIESVTHLKSWGFELVGFEEELKEADKIQSSIVELPKIDNIPGLGGILRKYQIEGVAHFEQKNGRALLADEMGLGKTIQVIAWLQLHPEIRPAIIVCPQSVKLNWARELSKWMDNPEIYLISGKNKNSHHSEYLFKRGKGEIIVINYDILNSWSERLSKNVKAVILDECHFIKNQKAKRTKAVRELCKGVQHIIPLSGTPIVNRPVEFFTTLNLVAPKLFPNFFKFGLRYCNGHQTRFGWDFNGASNTKELHELLSKTIMIRRLKKDVLGELPEKQRIIIPMDLDTKHKQEYDKANRAFLNWVKETFGVQRANKAANAEALTRIEALKQLAVEAKLESCIQWIKDYIESGEKLVIFGVHRKVLDTIEMAFPNISVRIDGQVSGNKRQEAVDKFQQDEKTRLFIGNIRAAGVGITLTAASTVAFLELNWTPGEHDQAEDRIHRIGQEADTVTIYYLLAAGTIEEDIALLIDEKRTVLTELLDGKETKETDLLTELLTKAMEDINLK